MPARLTEARRLPSGCPAYSQPHLPIAFPAGHSLLPDVPPQSSMAYPTLIRVGLLLVLCMSYVVQPIENMINSVPKNVLVKTKPNPASGQSETKPLEGFWSYS